MEEKGCVKLLGARPSPFVNRVQIALKLKSIEFEFLEETFSSKSELLLKSNPVQKKMPVLIHDDKPISESLIIVQYIDEQWTSGPSILPADPYDRAIARFWAAYLDDKWFPSLIDYSPVTGAEKAGALERVREGLGLLEDGFVKCGAGKPFFGGESIGYVDIAFGSFLGGLKVAEKMTDVKLLDESTTPSLALWAETFLSHEAVKGVILHTDALLHLVNNSAA